MPMKKRELSDVVYKKLLKDFIHVATCKLSLSARLSIAAQQNSQWWKGLFIITIVYFLHTLSNGKALI